MDPLRTEFEFPEKDKRTIDFYPFRVWISTLFFGPALFVLPASAFNGSNFGSHVYFALLFFVFSLILTLPFLFIFWYLYDVLKEREFSHRQLRSTLCLVTAGMVLLTFELFKLANFEDIGTSILLCSYIVANIALTFLLRFGSE